MPTLINPNAQSPLLRVNTTQSENTASGSGSSPSGLATALQGGGNQSQVQPPDGSSSDKIENLSQAYKMLVSSQNSLGWNIRRGIEGLGGGPDIGPQPDESIEENALSAVMQANGDVSKISQQDFTFLAQRFQSLPAPLQSAVKTSLNTIFAGQPDKPGSAVGDALQYASDGLQGGDADAAKNRYQDLQKFAAGS